mmetsp:Transcript_12929/g.24237  ORF Transcript_12929/g.24237 Transcript_12929/m.24237 type:complete len:215 (-) Transcript_12929:413-1057(-)
MGSLSGTALSTSGIGVRGNDGAAVILCVGASVALNEGAAVGFSVGAAVALNEGASVGTPLGESVGTGEGAPVGTPLGEAVGLLLGSVVTVTVGEPVAFNVGEAVVITIGVGVAVCVLLETVVWDEGLGDGESVVSFVALSLPLKVGVVVSPDVTLLPDSPDEAAADCKLEESPFLFDNETAAMITPTTSKVTKHAATTKSISRRDLCLWSFPLP